MRHMFLDVEAFGSPTAPGRVFAVGAVHFDMSGILDRRQFTFHQDDPRCSSGNLAWLLEQADEVRAQAVKALRDPGGVCSPDPWRDLGCFICPQPQRVMVWADDYSDFAWLEGEAERLGVPPLRGSVVCQADSSAITMVAGAGPAAVVDLLDRLPYKLTPHVAVDDATFGALHLIAAVKALGRTLPC